MEADVIPEARNLKYQVSFLSIMGAEIPLCLQSELHFEMDSIHDMW